MRIPVTINPNTLKTYNDHKTSTKNSENKLQSDNISDWDKDLPKSLQELCIEAIANTWQENTILDEIPLTINRCLLLNILSTGLPLKLTVPKIPDDIYWKRCYLERWPKLLPENVSTDFQMYDIIWQSNNGCRNSNGNGNMKRHLQRPNVIQRKWKECFLEMHLREYLEKLKPEDYDAEKIKELADLCGNYVKTLNIKELQCSESSPTRIPLNAIITGLQNLTELSICFKQIYIGEKFSWDVLKIPLQDVKLLAKGLEKCKLSVFRLQNSDIDDDKATIILKSLLKHEDLQILDFSHCQISDDGAVALAKFSMQNPVTDLIVANNRIGAKGIEALCYAICSTSCNLRLLNLKLNPITERSVQLLMKPLTMGTRNIKQLFLNGCGIKHSPAIGDMIEHNSTLEHLDLSNNSLGEEMGKIILQGLRYNANLKTLDVRMCKLRSEDELEIMLKINRNRKAYRLARSRRPIIIEPQFDFQISDQLLAEIENVFDMANGAAVNSE